MRRGRLGVAHDPAQGFYHCLSRVVDRRFIFQEAEREHFVALMPECQAFCQMRVLTSCVLSNPFHLLLEVPRVPPEVRPSAQEVLQRLRRLSGHQDVGAVTACIDQNPGSCRSGREDPKDYRWSGCGEAVAESLRCRDGRGRSSAPDGTCGPRCSGRADSGRRQAGVRDRRLPKGRGVIFGAWKPPVPGVPGGFNSPKRGAAGIRNPVWAELQWATPRDANDAMTQGEVFNVKGLAETGGMKDRLAGQGAL